MRGIYYCYLHHVVPEHVHNQLPCPIMKFLAIYDSTASYRKRFRFTLTLIFLNTHLSLKGSIGIISAMHHYHLG